MSSLSNFRLSFSDAILTHTETDKLTNKDNSGLPNLTFTYVLFSQAQNGNQRLNYYNIF